MPLDIKRDRDLVAQFRDIESRFSERDERHIQVAAARRGEVDKLMPGLFPKRFPRMVTANIVNTAAQDLGELLGELPDVFCRPARVTSTKSKQAASRRTKIVLNYIGLSRLQQQMYVGCDRLVTFSAMPFVVEADMEQSSPIIRVDDPQGAYYELDFLGRTHSYWKRWREPIGRLCAKFPDLANAIRGRSDNLIDPHAVDGAEAEVVKYYGPNKTCVFMPDRKGLVLTESENAVPGVTPVFVAELPKWDNQARGQFDQTIWIQTARARMALFRMEALDKAINAPIRTPKDVTKFNYGPNARIASDSPIPIERVRLDLPQGIFADDQMQQLEERTSARYPEGRSGSIDASIITGQGVKELLGTMDSQVKTLQDLIGRALGDALGYALRLDETIWGQVEKTIKGEADGAPFVERYTPAKDINGNYEVHTSYGLSYGMDHQRGLIFALQLRGDRIVDRGSVRAQFAKAFGVDAEEIGRLVDVEEMDDALKASIQQLAASVGNPELAAMGIDPRKVVQQLAIIQKQRLKGVSLVDAVAKALEPTKEELAAQQQQQQALAQADPAMAAMQELGLADAPGPATTMPTSPQGAQQGTLQMLLANLSSSGRAEMTAGTSRMLPT